ncbi:acetate--CoA ligase family protein, partial [Acinetobacter baumannii]
SGECLSLLKAYGVPTVEPVIAATPEDAAAAAGAFGGPVALKIVSPELTHKTDVGGVILNLAPDRVALEAAAMLDRIRAARPDAALEG